MKEQWYKLTWPCDEWYKPHPDGQFSNSGFYPESYLNEMYRYLANYGVMARHVNQEQDRVLAS